MFTLETFTDQQLADYRAAVSRQFADYTFTADYVSQMTSTRAAVAQSMALANEIAGYNPRNTAERINAANLRAAIGHMEAIASVIKYSQAVR